VPPARAGDRAGRETGRGFGQLVAPAVIRRPLWPVIGDLDRHGAARAIGLTLRTGTPSAPRSQARQAARHKGIWRCEPLQAECDENHNPILCAACGTPFEMWDRQSGHSAHFVLDLERAAGGIRIACVLHRYHAIECACGIRTAARSGVGVLSTVPGRSRDLLLSEACLAGPALATFIAALSVRYHVSRARIREFLAVWFGVPLSVGTLDRCIREVGIACEPVVEDLLGDLR